MNCIDKQKEAFIENVREREHEVFKKHAVGRTEMRWEEFLKNQIMREEKQLQKHVILVCACLGCMFLASVLWFLGIFGAF